MNLKAICIVAGVLLLAGALPLPYGYYQLLRLAICAAAIYVAYKHYELNKTSWVIVFAIVALLFNPVRPVFMDKAAWVVTDIAAAATFFVVSLLTPNRDQKIT